MTMIADSASSDVERLEAFHDLLPAMARALDVRDIFHHLSDVASRIVPHDGVYYAHDDFEVRTQNMHEDERKNGHAHVKAMLLSATSHAIPVIAGEPGFGRWQRLIFFEMDEPKDRTVTFHVFGS